MTKDEKDRLDRIEHTLHTLGTKLDIHLSQEDVATPKLEEVLEVFVQAQGVLKFIKICAACSAACGGAYLFIKEVLSHWRG